MEIIKFTSWQDTVTMIGYLLFVIVIIWGILKST
jgi:hypothetical protein